MRTDYTTWSETKIELNINKEVTVYEDGHWTAEDKIAMTVQRCGSPEGDANTPQ